MFEDVYKGKENRPRKTFNTQLSLSITGILFYSNCFKKLKHHYLRLSKIYIMPLSICNVWKEIVKEQDI